MNCGPKAPRLGSGSISSLWIRAKLCPRLREYSQTILDNCRHARASLNCHAYLAEAEKAQEGGSRRDSLPNIWPPRRSSERRMIPLVVRGVATGFHCSECAWALSLEQAFFYSNPARQARTDEAMHWNSAHDCLQFPKPKSDSPQTQLNRLSKPVRPRLSPPASSAESFAKVLDSTKFLITRALTRERIPSCCVFSPWSS